MAFVFGVLSFVLMEFIAWALHKYVMHGPLWSLHEDHHVNTGKWYQKNDLFVFVFAVPSILFIFLGHQAGLKNLAGVGYGVMIYGILYGIVHEVIIHRRWHFFRGRGWYFRALIMAHRDHHKLTTKEGATNFGMLWVAPRYFHLARKKHAPAG